MGHDTKAIFFHKLETLDQMLELPEKLNLDQELDDCRKRLLNEWNEFHDKLSKMWFGGRKQQVTPLPGWRLNRDKKSYREFWGQEKKILGDEVDLSAPEGRLRIGRTIAIFMPDTRWGIFFQHNSVNLAKAVRKYSSLLISRIGSPPIIFAGDQGVAAQNIFVWDDYELDFVIEFFKKHQGDPIEKIEDCSGRFDDKLYFNTDGKHYGEEYFIEW